MSETQEPVKFEGHAIVELMGRQVVAGYVTEQVIGGAAMLRVDVPGTESSAAYTKFYGGSAIYALTPTTEEVVLRAVQKLRPRPVEPWIVPAVAERRLVDVRGYEDDLTGDDDEDDDDGTGDERRDGAPF